LEAADAALLADELLEAAGLEDQGTDSCGDEDIVFEVACAATEDYEIVLVVVICL
jgi:hypothetical protein